MGRHRKRDGRGTEPNPTEFSTFRRPRGRGTYVAVRGFGEHKATPIPHPPLASRSTRFRVDPRPGVRVFLARSVRPRKLFVGNPTRLTTDETRDSPLRTRFPRILLRVWRHDDGSKAGCLNAGHLSSMATVKYIFDVLSGRRAVADVVSFENETYTVRRHYFDRTFGLGSNFFSREIAGRRERSTKMLNVNDTTHLLTSKTIGKH